MSRQATRFLVTLLPLLLAMLHVVGVTPMPLLERLDHLLYDARLRATMPRTLESRIVVVDVDERSLAEQGRWPWPRDRLAALIDTLFEQHRPLLLGMDTVLADADRAGAEGADSRLASSLANRPVVLGYYFTSDRGGFAAGQLPEPVMLSDALKGRAILFTQWNGYGANLPELAQAAPRAGFFNAMTDNDGVVRSLPLLAEHEGAFYESLALAMFRYLLGSPAVTPGFPPDRFLSRDYLALESVRLEREGQVLAIPVDERVSTLVPYRGPGGPQGGSFGYVSAADLLAGRLAPGSLDNKILLLGSTAPGLLDLRVTPVGPAYPGVETHANLLAALLDGQLKVRPDYAMGYELLQLLAVGLLLAGLLPRLSAGRAVLWSLGVVVVLLGVNTGLYLGPGLVLPLASTLVLGAAAFALNMSYGYFVESRAKRELAQRFGTYVPPELVDRMLRHPERYSMRAATVELTVMFCDMRGFTTIAEGMDPVRLQALLNTVFSRLTHVIREHRGTIDKYMGDCVMAFWGAPVAEPQHARLAVEAALAMVEAIETLNREHARQGLPAIGVGIGLNTGLVCVGDMGSDVRRSYTVIGDAVNLAARLEALSREYGVDIVVGDRTRQLAEGWVWQELDRVRVKGKAEAVTIHTPVAPVGALNDARRTELNEWQGFRRAWLVRDWDACEAHLINLLRLDAEKVLYRRWAERVASQRRQPQAEPWDGATHYETK